MHRLRWRKRVQLGDSLLAVASLTLAMPLAAAAPSAAQVDRPPSSVSYRIAPLEGLFDVSAFTMTGHVQRWQRMRPASIALAPVNEDEGWWPFGDIYTGRGLSGDVRAFASYLVGRGRGHTETDVTRIVRPDWHQTTMGTTRC